MHSIVAPQQHYAYAAWSAGKKLSPFAGIVAVALFFHLKQLQILRSGISSQLFVQFSFYV